MHREAYEFIGQFASQEPLLVVEFGSRNINGTVRDHFPKAHWIGLDLHDGPCVDVICDATEYTPPAPVDLVVCCEVLEHADNWRLLIGTAAWMLRKGGRFLMTCANPEREPHSHIDGGSVRPGEYYAGLDRTTVLEEITHHFSACQIQSIDEDLQAIAWK